LSDPLVVIVTETEFRKGEAVFTTAPGMHCIAAPEEEAALAEVIRKNRARFVIVGALTYRDALYDALPAGGLIARFGSGYEGIDLNSATRAGLLCTNTPGVLNQSVAELTILLIMAAARHLTPMARHMTDHMWSPRTGTEIRGKTLAVIGYGQIGRAVERIASDGFQMNVVSAGSPDEYSDAVRQADFVTLHIPATPANKHFIDRDRLAILRQQAWLINTSRGAVLDEAALYDALANRHIAGAALDVFEREPYVPVDPSRDLRTLPNVILTPHIGSNTSAAGIRIAERALQNVRLAQSGDFEGMDLLKL
jgi:phosphoglycerate dehydrogenase-like enzyme